MRQNRSEDYLLCTSTYFVTQPAEGPGTSRVGTGLRRKSSVGFFSFHVVFFFRQDEQSITCIANTNTRIALKYTRKTTQENPLQTENAHTEAETCYQNQKTRQ